MIHERGNHAENPLHVIEASLIVLVCRTLQRWTNTSICLTRPSMWTWTRSACGPCQRLSSSCIADELGGSCTLSVMCNALHTAVQSAMKNRRTKVPQLADEWSSETNGVNTELSVALRTNESTGLLLVRSTGRRAIGMQYSVNVSSSGLKSSWQTSATNAHKVASLNNSW